MSKDKTASANTFFHELFQIGLYKSSQGRITRQVTFAAMFVVVLLGSWRAYVTLNNAPWLPAWLDRAAGWVVTPPVEDVQWNPADPSDVTRAQHQFVQRLREGWRAHRIAPDQTLGAPVGRFSAEHERLRLHRPVRAPTWLRDSLVIGLPLLCLTLGTWVSYRMVNLPRFADFLVAVEAEMNKVSWPARSELIRSALVVIVVIFLLAVLLFGFDLMWKAIFQWVGVHRI